MSDADSALQANAKGGVVFVVDDEENDRLVVSRLIEHCKLPYSCRPFRRGEELLDALIDVMRGAPPPVACFVDVKMDGMSGPDVLRWIRAQGALNDIPVIMLSSSEEPAHLNESLRSGAQCYVAKFPSANQLREIIAAAERYCAAASCSASFPLSCNLLAGSRQPA
jgi:CheY-like chemotaxis protein